MGTSGSFYGKTSNSAIKPKITWSAQENVAGNYSDVTAKLYYSRTDGYTTYGYWAGAITINGDKKSADGKHLEISKNSNTLAITHTVRVYHSDDGTKTITISGSGAIDGTTLTKTTISEKVVLPNIPRAATIAAADADIGSVAMVTVGRKSDSYSHTVAYQFGNRSGYLSETGLSDTPVLLTAVCLAFPLPEDFYYEIPEKPSELCTLTCTTYLEDQIIGTPQQTTFRVRANPEHCALLLEVSAEDENPNTVALTGNPQIFVRSQSNIRCDITAQGRWGAEILEKRMGGEQIFGDTLHITAPEGNMLRFTAMDSRGFTAERMVDLQMIPYFTPIVRLNASRTDATSGNAVLQGEGSFFSGDFGLRTNNLQAFYQINAGEPVELIPVVEEDRFTLEAELSGLDYTKSHRITLTVRDALSEVSTNVLINPGIPVFHWGASDFTFQVPVYYRGKLLEEQYLPKDAEGNLELSGNRITGLGEPVEAADAATKAYADGKISIQRLWTNPDPTQNFAAQDVSLDLKDFQWVAIYCRLKTDNAQMKMHFAQVGTQVGLDVITSSGYRGLRKANVTETGIHFNTATYVAANLNEGVVGYIVPVAIYGISGVGEQL